MTKIFTFPIIKNSALICVWIRTENSRRPLICKWIAAEKTASGDVTEASSRLCAAGLCA
jgi:hypothetical protein